MVEVACLYIHLEIASVDVRAFIGALMEHACDIAAAFSDYLGYLNQLARPVHKLDCEVACSAGHEKSAVDYPGEDGNIYVAAGDEAAYILACKIRNLVVHYGSKGDSACAFGYHLLFFNESQDGSGNLLVGYGYNSVHIL